MTEYHEHSRILQANFRNMTLRDKGRGDRRGTESVAEEKFSIVFQVFRSAFFAICQMANFDHMIFFGQVPILNTSMLETKYIGENVGDSFSHFGHQHPLLRSPL